MYQFENNYRYSIYSTDGNFGGLEDAGNSPNPYTVEEDIITIDLFFGTIVNYQMNYRCDGQVVEFIYIPDEIIHSTLFREGYNFIDNECEEVLEECFDFTDIDFGECEMVLGVGLLNDECNFISGCDWTIDGIDYSDLFFDSMGECEEVCDTDYQIDLGDINFDEEINVLDVVLLVSFILGNPTDEFEYIAADINEDNNLNVLDVVILIDMILNPTSSIQINSGTSYGECWGYCVFELELDNSSALFKASSWGWDPYGELPDLILEDNLNQIVWQQLINLIDFEYFLSLEDVYGCPDCADGGAEFIEITYDGVIKLVTFDAYTEIDGIQELTLLLRDLRTDYWNQINPNQECYIVPEVGPCDGICPTFYYNQSTNECEEFITGCCGVEVFSTLQECQNICE